MATKHPAIRRVALASTILLAACTSGGGAGTTTPTIAETTTTASAPVTTTTAPTTTTSAQPDEHSHDGTADPGEVALATLATAAFQDVTMAESAGYVSTMGTLGCFESVENGGMGLHYLNESLLDTTVDITTPEALVYELDSTGDIAGLVAHEYIVPVEAWTDDQPPSLFGMDFHQHPVLPLWVLHAWIWKDNPSGVFNDWNPTVRLCPEGVPVFGVDLP